MHTIDTMGWFDDESDGEQQQQQTAASCQKRGNPHELGTWDAMEIGKPSAAIASATKDTEATPEDKDQPNQTLQRVHNDDDDEDDPLDAYMKSLSQGVSSSSASSERITAGGAGAIKSRMDLDQEDEAAEEEENDDNAFASTARSSRKRRNKALSSSAVSPGENQGREKESSLSSVHNPLASYFVKAGSHQKDHWMKQQAVSLQDEGHKDRKDEKDSVGHHDSRTNKTSHSTASSVERIFWTPTDTVHGHRWRQTHSVTCSKSTGQHHQQYPNPSSSSSSSPATAMDPIFHFDELRDVFGQPLLQAIQQAGYHHPTLVQSQTLPVALSGSDAIITAATGQGKTLTYVWPLAVHVAHQRRPLQPDETGPMALILVPTRELATQVHQTALPMIQAALQGTASPTWRHRGTACRAVIGGQGKYLLRQELKRSGGVQVVVATPGRLLDVLGDKKGLSLSRVTFCVLDEADKLLQMGFEHQVRQILQNIPSRERQTLMLSATMGRKIERVAQEWLLPHPYRIAVGRTGEASENVQQHVMVLPDAAAKKIFLLEMLPSFREVGRTLVFVATREGCERLAQDVREQQPDLTLDTLHGDKHQMDRTRALKDFAKGRISVLIATDVASRGLDVPQVATVINYDPPKNLDAHVHRVGRAGRLSKEEQQVGAAYTLLTRKDADFAHVLRNSFEREGREISQELEALARQSRKSGNVASRSKVNVSGLGYDPQDRSRWEEQEAPAKKKSRWS